MSAWIGGRSRGRQLPKVSAAKGALNRREARIVFFSLPKNRSKVETPKKE